MCKLIIQIPAYNEEKTIAKTLQELPRKLPGISKIEWLLINDGSSDKTSEIAKKIGVDHIVTHTHNQGLAKAFMSGIHESLKQGAHIIVNTDADNQYSAKDIQTIINPILEKKADIVIGARPIQNTTHFSWIKKLLQKLGSFVVRQISNTNIQDAPSGFRAISRSAALNINIFSTYTYTIEMIIQAGKKNMAIQSIPIRTNKDERPSRLVRSIPSYIIKTLSTMIRIFNVYKPLHFFLLLSTLPLLTGLFLGLRWIFLFMGKGQALHLPSLILASILLIIGTQLCLFGLVADLISVNRKLLEDVQHHLRKKTLPNDTK